jgi:NADH-quinone oxidoreductase subunit B
MESQLAKPRILELGLACCAVEASAADLLDEVFTVLQPQEVARAAAHILVVAGTITHALAPTVQAAYASLAEPKVVIAFGVCAISGGPYWDSYSVLNGADHLVPVDIMVPGCPPSPQDLTAALTTAIARVAQ